MKKAKRKFNKAKHKASAFAKSPKMLQSEVIKQLVPRDPKRPTVRYT